MHLTSSRFFGGPERQMLGLAVSMRGRIETVFASFSETGLNQAFLSEVSREGFPAISLQNDHPHLISACREVRNELRNNRIDVLVCHGYKAGILGWMATRCSEVEVIAVSRGWTAENWKIRVYEMLDRIMLRRMKKVVCVSRAQADRVRAAGIRPARIAVIHNSIATERFVDVDRQFRTQLEQMFPENVRPEIRNIVGAAGRLSREKGFDVLVDAAARVIDSQEKYGKQETAFILFGDGDERANLEQKIAELNIGNWFVLAGFCKQLDQFMPHFNLFVQSSHTEGLPNVLLESLAAGVPVVATDVGGTSEVLTDGQHGRLVPPADPIRLAQAIEESLRTDEQNLKMIDAARERIAGQFTFTRQAADYEELFTELATSLK